MIDAQNTAQSAPERTDAIIHDIIAKPQSTEIPMKKTLLIFGAVILLGIVSGLAGSFIFNGGSTTTSQKTVSSDGTPESAGIVDKKTFKDQAEGKLEAGGHESGEGSYQLIRPGGEDQTAYLTSSTVDLSEFVGQNVRVYGETFDSQHVGWLMDVGFVEVIK